MSASITSNSTASISPFGQSRGVKLTPTSSEASSKVQSKLTPFATNISEHTLTASVVSGNPNSSTSFLSFAFAQLTTENQKKALHNVSKRALSKAFKKREKTVLAEILGSSTGSHVLITGFNQLDIEDQKSALLSIKKSELKAAFKKRSGNDSEFINSNSSTTSSNASVIISSAASVDTLQSAFGKLSVENQVKALANIDAFSLEKAFDATKSNKKDTRIAPVKENHGIPQANLAEWQELCRACGQPRDEIPLTITKCKEILKTKNVALSELQEAIQNGTVAQTFPSLKKLRQYVVNHGRIANKAQMKENRLLKTMLRSLFNPSYGKK